MSQTTDHTMYKQFAAVMNCETKRGATIHYGAEWGEFMVRFSTDGKHHPDADYFTDDRLDALNTATHWTNEVPK